MGTDERRAAKARLVAGMRRGVPWRDAAAVAGLPTSRSAAYRLRAAVRDRGEVALEDGRRGHPAKLRGPVRAWLETYCRGAPEASGSAVHQALQARFGLAVSVRQINRVRAALGVGRPASRTGGEPGQAGR